MKDFIDVSKPIVSAMKSKMSDNASTITMTTNRQSKTLDPTIIRNDHLKAKITYALKILSSNYPYKSF